jgi:hypothetical protein
VGSSLRGAAQDQWRPAMTPLRGRRVALWSAVLGVAALAGTGYAVSGRVQEEYWLRRLTLNSPADVEAVRARLKQLDPGRIVPRLLTVFAGPERPVIEIRKDTALIEGSDGIATVRYHVRPLINTIVEGYHDLSMMFSGQDLIESLRVVAGIADADALTYDSGILTARVNPEFQRTITKALDAAAHWFHDKGPPITARLVLQDLDTKALPVLALSQQSGTVEVRMAAWLQISSIRQGLSSGAMSRSASAQALRRIRGE